MPAFQAIPIFRIFDVEKATEFYVAFLGFHVDWEARFDETALLYLQVSRDGLVLHLSEHHGDGCPGSTVAVQTTGLEEYHRESIGNTKALIGSWTSLGVGAPALHRIVSATLAGLVALGVESGLWDCSP